MCPSDPHPRLRFRARHGRLLILVALSRQGAGWGRGRQLALVASPTPPFLRRLTVYRTARPLNWPDLPRPAA